jgi:hypothetical protein
VTFNLPTLGEMRAKPSATPKGQIVPRVIEKAEKKKSKERQHAEFRAAVWARDKSRSRFSRKPLGKSGTDYDKVGEVHHVLARSTHPDKVYDVSNGILLSKSEHALAETRCPQMPEFALLSIEGPADRGEPQTFTLRDLTGKILKTRVG